MAARLYGGSSPPPPYDERQQREQELEARLMQLQQQQQQQLQQQQQQRQQQLEQEAARQRAPVVTAAAAAARPMPPHVPYGMPPLMMAPPPQQGPYAPLPGSDIRSAHFAPPRSYPPGLPPHLQYLPLQHHMLPHQHQHQHFPLAAMVPPQHHLPPTMHHHVMAPPPLQLQMDDVPEQFPDSLPPREIIGATMGLPWLQAPVVIPREQAEERAQQMFDLGRWLADVDRPERLRALQQDKFGVSLVAVDAEQVQPAENQPAESRPISFGRIAMGSAQRVSVALRVTNNNPDIPIKLVQVRILPDEQSLSVSHGAQNQLHIKSGGKVDFSLVFDVPDEPGLTACWAVFEFEFAQSGCVAVWSSHRFIIVRRVTALVYNADDECALDACAPRYVPQALRDQMIAEPDDTIALLANEIPVETFEFDQDVCQPELFRRPPNSAGVPVGHRAFATLQAYKLMMTYLVQLELYQHHQDIQKFDMFEQNLTHVQYDHEAQLSAVLTVPGAREQQPYVLLTDRVLFRWKFHNRLVHCEARVLAVHKQVDVVLRLPSRAASFVPDGDLENAPMNVRFTIDSQPFFYMLRTLRSPTSIPPHCVLPAAIAQAVQSLPFPPTQPQLRLFDKSLNPEQMKAVATVCAMQPAKRPPFVVFGPPGTGKTVTIIEMISQLLVGRHAWPDEPRLLVLAPSTSAADVICSRLSKNDKFTPDIVLRLNSHKRLVSSVLPTVLPFCCQDQATGSFVVPSDTTIRSYKAVVTTCAMAGTLVSRGLPRGHFTHIIVDEAAQALEPEILIALELALETTPLVLAGDVKQLGAAVRSPRAVELGLGVSLQERLMKELPYAHYDPRVVVKLVRNYRSHPSLIELPSKSFYDGELEACAPTAVVGSLCQWEEVDSGCPVMWYGIVGQEVFEDNSCSSYNLEEASKIADIVGQLLAHPDLNVTMKDFGVIAPYRRQVDVIRKILRSREMNAVRVGTVDDYQGQEALITLVSTVTCLGKRHQWALSRQTNTVGFVGNAKRFNVAVTRAKALLIIVGNPVALVSDRYWSELLFFCAEKGNYRGCPFPGSNCFEVSEEMADVQMTEEFAALAAQTAVLGSDDAWHPPEDLASYYRDELDFRVVL